MEATTTVDECGMLLVAGGELLLRGKETVGLGAWGGCCRRGCCGCGGDEAICCTDRGDDNCGRG